MNRKNALLRSTQITILNGETISAAELLSELNEVTYMNEEARMHSLKAYKKKCRT